MSAPANRLAIQRGEVHSNAALAWGSAKTSYGDLGQEDNVIAKYSPTTDPKLADVPIMPQGKPKPTARFADPLFA